MKKVIIGHRGVGKTSFLKRHESYLKQAGQIVPHFDLDQQIELDQKDTILNIYKNKGEKYFREVEAQIFSKLISENTNYVISLGAGFNMARISSEHEVLLLSRLTDRAGRLFLNRPRLNADETPLDEYHIRYLERHEKFLDKATALYSIPEGIECENEIERKIVTGQFYIEDAFYTLTEKEIPLIESLLAKFKTIELRNDLLATDKINFLVKTYVQPNWLISVRKDDEIFQFENARYDYDIELKGRPRFFEEKSTNILSCHTDDIDAALAKVQNITNHHIKLSPSIEQFSDLIKGFNWQQEDPQNRSFLPRSKNGKWMWFRQLAKYFQEINFIRNFSFLKDQPSKYQWLLLPENRPKSFGAVLGQPVVFSRSPEFHREFFSQFKSFFTAIELSEVEFLANIEWLAALGLNCAAVTSPLKRVAYQFASESSEVAKQFESVNTLFLGQNQIQGTNTDVHGFIDLIQNLPIDEQSNVAVWGGGGTLNMMKSVLPNATYYSSQTGLPREGQALPVVTPDILIWAAPRNPQTLMTPIEWAPKIVGDLNYFDNSMGLEYAQLIKSNYVSGLNLFKVQGLHQQKFWKPLIEKDLIK